MLAEEPSKLGPGSFSEIFVQCFVLSFGLVFVSFHTCIVFLTLASPLTIPVDFIMYMVLVSLTLGLLWINIVDKQSGRY